MKSFPIAFLGLLVASAAVSALRFRESQAVSLKGGLRIVDGSPANPGQFPYQAAIYMDSAYFCGGSLISKDWVLTAGHCGDGFSMWTVYLGAYNMMKPHEKGRQVHITTNVHVHELFDDVTLKNDLSVLKLNTPVKLSDSISIIPLPSKQHLDELFVGIPARISGWGRLKHDSPTITPQLQYVDLVIISNDVCNATYDSEPIFNTTLCCQGEGIKSTCQGDSGGPLVVYDEDQRPFQVGVVSFGSDSGCDKGFPHGYSRLTSYMTWISKQTGIPIRD